MALTATQITFLKQARAMREAAGLVVIELIEAGRFDGIASMVDPDGRIADCATGVFDAIGLAPVAEDRRDAAMLSYLTERGEAEKFALYLKERKYRDPRDNIAFSYERSLRFAFS